MRSDDMDDLEKPLPVVIVDPEGSAFIPYAIAFVLGGILLFIASKLIGK